MIHLDVQGFPNFISYIGKLSGIVGGPGEGGASGVCCCGVCVDLLSSAMLSSSPFLWSARSHM